MENNLNPMQQEAVLHRDGPLLIFAGAGSGKTRVLTYRIAHLIEEGIDPYHILAITFTNKAAKEMRDRVSRLTTEGSRCWIATFHSTCVRILRRDIDRLGYNTRFTIFDTADSERLLKGVLDELNLDEKHYPVRLVSNTISNQKNELISPNTFARESLGDFQMSNIAEAYDLYQKKLRANNALDFDDIIFRAVELFEQVPEVLQWYQDRFQYIMVDEYQDTNTAQYRLISLLAGSRQNLCVVGDDDQSIYGWRGANIQNILSFERDFPKARIIKLEQNYRSTQNILDAANTIIQNNYNRSEKALWTDKGEGEKIKVYKAPSDGEEASFVSETIKELKEEAKYSDFAVLYRNNAQSRAIEDKLVMSGIPYRLYGGVRFYERMEVKDVLAYLKALANPSDSIAWGRIVNVPRRGIGDKTIQRLVSYAAEQGLTLSAAIGDAENIPGVSKKTATALKAFADLMKGFWEFSQKHSVTKLLEKILEETAYLKSLADGTPEAASRIENVQELNAKAFEFEAAQSDEEGRGLIEFLEDVALVADIDNYEESADTVSLLTLHSAKGLEFKRVFIIGFEEGLFPSYRAVTSGRLDDLEEERRLCYVGITRACEVLYITYALRRFQYGREVHSTASRFMKEIPRDYYQHVSMPGRLRKVQDAAAPISPRRAAVEKRHNPYRKDIPEPKDKPVEFAVGDRVRQMKYGSGTVKSINPAGADYEVTVDFDRAGEKKIMAHLSRLIKEA